MSRYSPRSVTRRMSEEDRDLWEADRDAAGETERDRELEEREQSEPWGTR